MNKILCRTTAHLLPTQTCQYSRHLLFSAVSVFIIRRCTNPRASWWRSRKWPSSVSVIMRPPTTKTLYASSLILYRPRKHTISTVSHSSTLISPTKTRAVLPLECSSNVILYRNSTYRTTFCVDGSWVWRRIIGGYPRFIIYFVSCFYFFTNLLNTQS